MNAEHLRAILWLRSRLSRNQWRRAGRLNAALRAVVLVAGVFLVAGGGLGGFALGAWVLPRASSWVTWATLAGVSGLFVFLWLIGVVVEIQRSEAIDLQRLLHLPVTLGQIFTINYLASLLSPTFLLFLPTLLGLAAGLTWGVGWSMLWLVPLVLSGLFVITAWTYCLRGWLVSLMVNKRRRRAIIAGLTIGLILIAQVPNLVFNNPYARNYIRSKERAARQAQSPPQTSDSSGERGSLESSMADPPSSPAAVPWLSACGLSVLGFVLGGLGLRRAYRMTLRFYQGVESGGRPAVRRAGAEAIRDRSSWMERGVPGCSEEVSAMTWVFLRSMLRAPETKMAMVMPVVMVLVFGSMNMARRGGSSSPDLVRPFLVTGAAAVGLFAILQLAANTFGTDRNGFRALVLLPVSRSAILVAKNLALFPMATLVSGMILGAAALLWSASAGELVAGFLQFLSGYLLVCIVGNYTSIRIPYRVAPGSLKPTKTTYQTTLMLFLLYLLYPVALLPLAFPPVVALVGSFLLPLDRVLLNFLGSVLLLLVAICVYRFTLAWGGHYLQSREQQILETVTVPVE